MLLQARNKTSANAVETDESPFREKDRPDVYIVVDGEVSVAEGQKFARRLRGQYPSLRIMCQCGGGKKSQHVKRASNLNARMAAIMQQSEDGSPRNVELRKFTVGFEPVIVPLDDCAQEIARLLKDTEAIP